MKVTPRIELRCRKIDSQSFKRIGFTSTATLDQTGATLAINMTASEVDAVLVSTLVAFGLEGKPFAARVSGFEYGLSLLIASYEWEVVAVPTDPNSCQPSVLRCEVKSGSGEEAKQYRIVKEKLELALENEEKRI